MSEEDTLDDVENRIREFYLARDRLSEVCDKKGLAQLMREARRLAKREKRLMDYLSFTYTLEESVTAMLEGAFDRDLCLEIIGLLEDEDKARAFGPNFDLDHYEYTRGWMLPQIYKSLADVTGEIEGYNSPGMHACIAEGINVSRQLNYREGIIYFREFAFEVYQAADDLDMALHFARETMTIQSHGNDRKVASADDASRALGLQGRFSEAVEQVLEGWGYCETFHNPYMAKLNFLPLLRETCAAAGRADLLAQFPQVRWPHEVAPGDEGDYLVFPPRGTDPVKEATADRSLAVEAACAGDFDKAIAILKPWTDLCLQHQAVYPLLENRCRLMAVYRLAGRMAELQEMAKSTEPIAKRANDWLTLHVMKCLLDESFPANPLNSVGPADCGPYAPTTPAPLSGADVPVASATDEESADADGDIPKTPLMPFFQAIYESLESGAEQAPQEAIDRILQLHPQAIENPLDAEQALNVLNYLVDAARESSVSAWGDQLLTRFPGESGIVSMLAVLKNTLRELTTADGQASAIAPEDIHKLLLRAMDGDAECGRSFARAGLHYLSENNFGEAERCLARAFRLNRQSASCAMGLAEVYANTERPRDALAVLDMALREGCEEPRLAWHAAMHASALGQFEVMLTYLNYYGERVPEQKWLSLFRAVALIELNRPEEVLEQLELELKLNPDAQRMVPLLSACALAQLNRVDEFRKQLEAALMIPLREMDITSVAELSRMLTHLWTSACALLPGEPGKERLEDVLLKACLAPAELFEKLRLEPAEEKASVEVHFYRIYLGQVLDDDWPTSEGCLSGEEPWKAYNILWCVLAEDEEKATEVALAWQARCCTKPAEVLGVNPSEEVFNDVPGVYSQGPRAGLVESENQE